MKQRMNPDLQCLVCDANIPITGETDYSKMEITNTDPDGKYNGYGYGPYEVIKVPCKCPCGAKFYRFYKEYKREKEK